MSILKAEQDVFRIGKVTRRDHKKKVALVNWDATNDEFNTWVPFRRCWTRLAERAGRIFRSGSFSSDRRRVKISTRGR